MLSDHQLILLPSRLQAELLLSRNTFSKRRAPGTIVSVNTQTMIRIQGLALPALRPPPSGDILMVYPLPLCLDFCQFKSWKIILIPGSTGELSETLQPPTH